MTTVVILCFMLFFTVDVYGRRAVNMARGLQTLQGPPGMLFSTNQTSGFSSILDGNTDTNIYHGSCVFTQNTSQPWVAVNLGRPTIVTGVKITNMATTCNDKVYSGDSRLYPYGTASGDTIAGTVNNLYDGPVAVPGGFPFLSNRKTSVYINNNGMLSFNAGQGGYCPVAFPFGAPASVAVYWADVDLSGTSGKIFYRVVSDTSLLKRAAREIQQYFTFEDIHLFRPTWMMIATWSNVSYYGGAATNKVSTFQAVLVTDSQRSYAMYNYDQLTWTTGMACGGSSQGLGGFLPAQVGFGDGTHYYSDPKALTPAVINMTEGSNIGIQGRYMYRIDGPQVLMPNCTPPTVLVKSRPVMIGLSDVVPSVTNAFNYEQCGLTYLTPDGSTVQVNCNKSLTGVYLIVQLLTTDSLAFCEMEIFTQGYNWVRLTNSQLVHYTAATEITVDYQTQCQTTCYQDGNCDSVNYRAMDKTCQLLTQYNPSAVNQTDVITDDQWEFWRPQYTVAIQAVLN